MSFEDSFCPSPWLHMRINTQGIFEYCRWARSPRWHNAANLEHRIQSMTPQEYFQQVMSPIRKHMLAGERPIGCQDCYKQDVYKKASGRMRQLLKIGVMQDEFEKSFLSSPWLDEFQHSLDNNGDISLLPVDWQIDLSNYCNSGCLFCHPESSSVLTTQWLDAGLINQAPANSWCADPAKLTQFVQLLIDTPNLKYLHFIGGETLITPQFKTILSALVDAGKSETVTVGFTTNLVVWDESIVDLLTHFESVNLGLSIEAIDEVNDYARWPSKISKVKDTLDRWVALANNEGWLVQLRTTPTILTVAKLHTVHDYALKNDIPVESCNFLADPAHFRPNVLPPEYRKQAIQNMQNWIDTHKRGTVNPIINTRDHNVAYDQIIQDAESYIAYLENEPDESYRLPVLIDYLKRMDTLRGNSVLDYLPEYEELFRTAGYTR